MRFLIVNTNYDAAIDWLYRRRPELLRAEHEAHEKAYEQLLPGTTQFYAMNLRKLGHEAIVVMANNVHAQRAWAAQHRIGFPGDGPSYTTAKRWRSLLTRSPIRQVRRRLGHRLAPLPQPNWVGQILTEQVQRYRPDVLINLAMDDLSPKLMRSLRDKVGLLVGEGDANLPLERDYRCYDLVRSSLRSHVKTLQARGIDAQLYRFGFEPEVMKHIQPAGPQYPLTFVGALSQAHQGRCDLLENLCQRFDLKVWAGSTTGLNHHPHLRKALIGSVFGHEMFQVLRDSRITLNAQIDTAGDQADNMRLYEATGTGAMLLTDAKANLDEMFEPGREVITYRDAEEAAWQIQRYQQDPAAREAVAQAGRQRTLSEHTYFHRMKELVQRVA